MIIDWVLIEKCAAAAVYVAGSLYIVMKYVKETKARKQGLEGNPTRCLRHESSIKILEGRISNVESSVEALPRIEETLHHMQCTIDTLLNLHLTK